MMAECPVCGKSIAKDYKEQHPICSDCWQRRHEYNKDLYAAKKDIDQQSHFARLLKENEELRFRLQFVETQYRRVCAILAEYREYMFKWKEKPA